MVATLHAKCLISCKVLYLIDILGKFEQLLCYFFDRKYASIVLNALNLALFYDLGEYTYRFCRSFPLNRYPTLLQTLLEHPF